MSQPGPSAPLVVTPSKTQEAESPDWPEFISPVPADSATGREKLEPKTKPKTASKADTNYATGGTNPGKSRGRKPNKEGFSWDRVKTSRNGWAYRVRESMNSATGGKRGTPVTVRYLSDEAAKIFEGKDKEALKRLVGIWYEQKSGKKP